jgi:uncharacterized protein (TIGR03084 family)
MDDRGWPGGAWIDWSMKQAQDFRDESAALADLLAPLSEEEFEKPTLFKGWTINDILRHLYIWNIGVGQSMNGDSHFAAFLAGLLEGHNGRSFRGREFDFLEGMAGRELFDQWAWDFDIVAGRFASIDPKERLKWVGPDMSALSSCTARLMETWAHAQAIYDLLGVERIDADRIGNIVRLGVNTYGWTFRNRKEEPPGPMPRLRLTAPSGAIWEYGEGDDLITGNATEFCQVVTQCRNIADTSLQVTGPIATRWMAIAQCFAGPANDPPPPGARHMTVK